MKVYISADIEGVTGITHWDEATHTKPDYSEFRDQMTAEVNAACEGALAAGADEIVIKDAHATGRNILASHLPSEARLIRGWSGHPYAMIQELDDTFDALLYIGYHSGAATGGNPLAHTMASSRVAEFRINDNLASEFILHGYAAKLHNVPSVFLAGDQALCDSAKVFLPAIETVAVKQGVGNSVVSIQPDLAVSRIREGVKHALKGDLSACQFPTVEHFSVSIRFTNVTLAYKASFYPRVKAEDALTVRFETDDYFEVMRFVLFVI